MKNIKFLLILCILTIILSNCTSTNKLMQSWVGDTKAHLYQKWGPPSRVTDDGQGGEIVIYEYYVRTGQTPGQVYNNNNGTLGYTAPQQNGYTKSRMFYVNRQGVIYAWRWQGY